MARPTYSEPLNVLQFTASLERCLDSNLAWRLRYRISYIKEDLPEPETPVIAFRQPNCTSASKLFILKICPPRIMILPFGSRRIGGTSILVSPRRYERV